MLAANDVIHRHQQLTPSRTVVTSFTPRQRPSAPNAYVESNKKLSGEVSSAYDEGDWIICLATSPPSSSPCDTQQSSTICCALSNGNVQIYDQRSLLPISSYRPSPNNSCVLVTDMKYGLMDTTPIVFTTCNDGSFVIKDLRQPSDMIANSTNICALRNSHNEAALSFALGYDGSIVALSSSKGYIHFIDLRKMMTSSAGKTVSLLGSYVNSHGDAITQIEFHPERTSILMSAGEDGLICLHDTTKPTEEQALETVINTGIPCRKAGFCDDKYIFCLTGSETASLWDWNTASCVTDFGNFSLRDTLAGKAMIPINYLVDAKWDPANCEILLCAGNHEGNTAIFKHNVKQSNSFWEASEVLIGGHNGIVRAWHPSSASTKCFTAGEDARLCEWQHRAESSMLLSGATDVSMETETNDVSFANRVEASKKIGGPIRKQRHSSNTATKPY